MLDFLKRRKRILVIGSAHLDVLADFQQNEKERIDKEGHVSFAIGGCAFNVASNIATRKDVDVSLYTHLHSRSIISNAILDKLKRTGVSRNYVFKDATIERDSGFIAHRMNGGLSTAVSSMTIEHAQLDETKLNRAIGTADVVVAECNLSSFQLQRIASICTSKSKPLLVDGISESKCRRILALTDTDPPPLDWFSLTLKEATSLLDNTPPTDTDATRLCRRAKSRHVLVADGTTSWKVYCLNGEIHAYDAPPIPAGVQATTGHGSAVTASLAHYAALNDGRLDWQTLRSHINEFVARRLTAPERQDKLFDATIDTAHYTKREFAGIISVILMTAGNTVVILIQTLASLDDALKWIQRFFEMSQ